MSEIKFRLDKINSRLNITEETLSKLEEIAIETIWYETQRKRLENLPEYQWTVGQCQVV